MALDMYLEARCSVAPGDATLAPTRKAISDAIGYVAPMAKPINDPASLEVSAVMVRLGYWLTFWPLHYWFVNNLQEGNDDNRPVRVGNSALEELEDALDQVDDDPLSVTEHFVVDDGSTLVGSELAYTQKVIAAARQLQRRGWDIYYRSSS